VWNINNLIRASIPAVDNGGSRRVHFIAVIVDDGDKVYEMTGAPGDTVVRPGTEVIMRHSSGLIVMLLKRQGNSDC